MTRKELLAYLAGFVDADGSITIVSAHCGSYIQYRAKLSVFNCKREPIILFQRTFGGGKLRHKKVRGHRKWRRCYEWILTNRQATRAIKQLLPFLILKVKQAKACIDLQRLKDSHTAVERRWDRRLNARLQRKFLLLKRTCNALNKRGT